jgi:hypothetical protein
MMAQQQQQQQQQPTMTLKELGQRGRSGRRRFFSYRILIVVVSYLSWESVLWSSRCPWFATLGMPCRQIIIIIISKSQQEPTSHNKETAPCSSRRADLVAARPAARRSMERSIGCFAAEAEANEDKAGEGMFFLAARYSHIYVALDAALDAASSFLASFSFLFFALNFAAASLLFSLKEVSAIGYR